MPTSEDFVIHGFMRLRKSETIPVGVARRLFDLMVEKDSGPRGRVLSVTAAVAQAVEELEQYHEFLAEALRPLSFSYEEAFFLVHVSRYYWVSNSWEITPLWQEIEDNLVSPPSSSGDVSWEFEFVQRLKRLTTLEALAVMRAAQRIRWCTQEDEPCDMVVDVGLVKPAQDRVPNALTEAGTA